MGNGQVQDSRDRGKFIPLGKCPDCGQDWGMFESEKAFWEKMIAEKDYKFPKRCKNCRDNKKVQKRVSIEDLVDDLQRIADRVVNEEFDVNADQLAQELSDIARKLAVFARKRRD